MAMKKIVSKLLFWWFLCFAFPQVYGVKEGGNELFYEISAFGSVNEPKNGGVSYPNSMNESRGNSSNVQTSFHSEASPLKTAAIWGAAGIAVGAITVPLAMAVYNKLCAKQDPFPCFEVKDLSFDDFIGQEEVVAQAMAFVIGVKEWQRCEAIGARRVKGLMVDGARNNGKTLLVNIIAAELGAQMIPVSANFFVEGGAAGGQREFSGRLDYVFSFAKEKAKKKLTVLFIDDLEMLDASIQNSGYLFSKQMEALVDTPNLILIGEVGGSASDMSRYGIERVSVLAPDLEGRRAILEYYLSKASLADELVAEKVARKWERQLCGESAGDLKNFIQQAGLLAIQDGSDVITMDHFEEAYLKQAYGQKVNFFRTKEELWNTAIHEAGHSLAAILTGQKVSRVTIIPSDIAGGAAFFEQERESWLLNGKTDMLKRAIAALGGYCAEKIMFGETTGGVVFDLQSLNVNLLEMVGAYGMGGGKTEAASLETALSEKEKEYFDEEIYNLRQKVLAATMTLLEKNKNLLCRLAEILLEKEVLYEEEIYMIVGQPRDETVGLL